MRGPLEVRFWAKVVKSREPDGCWLFNPDSPERYPKIRDGERARKAHHVGFELQNGPIPDGMNVLHSCDVTRCIRGSHLFAGTQLDNIADRVAKGRSSGGKGYTVRAGTRRLTPERVLRIRGAASLGMAHGKIAAREGVAPATVYKIAKRITWRDL